MSDDSKWWLEALRESLLDADYCVANDSETSFKIAAIDDYIARNELLETKLAEACDAIDGARKILGKIL